MNFLKKKLKPLTQGFNQPASAAAAAAAKGTAGGASGRDLEEDLYDEYVVEAPPHPSELLALGVNPDEIDVNDPDKLRELYRKAQAEGKDKNTNSVLLARQRQKEEIEEKKRTREEWKFFDSLSSRVEQVVKESQRNLDHWRESSAVSELAEPEYELRQTADEVFRPVTTVKLEKGQNDWIDFGDDASAGASSGGGGGKQTTGGATEGQIKAQELDEFGCPVASARRKESAGTKFVVEELLEDFGIDLRTAEQKRALEEKQRQEAEAKKKLQELESQRKKQAEQQQQQARKSSIDIKAAARPRPRPRGRGEQEEPAAVERGGQEAAQTTAAAESEIDPFQTSFVSDEFVGGDETKREGEQQQPAKFIDPFDTSNPFLSDWDDDEAALAAARAATNAHLFDALGAASSGGGGGGGFETDQSGSQQQQQQTQGTNRRSSCSQAEGANSGSNNSAVGAAARAGLYRRNMSSFEAASLQLEAHQQAQMLENGGAGATPAEVAAAQKELIARMTADFQSAIQTSDKQFDAETTTTALSFNPFDPFETIVDDDVGPHSPGAPNHGGGTPAADSQERASNKFELPECTEPPAAAEVAQQAPLKHDSIDDDEADLVSTPVRNIKLSSPTPQAEDAQTPGGAEEPHQQLEESSETLRRATLMASLLASAEQAGQTTTITTTASADSAELEPCESGTSSRGGGVEANAAAAHVIKGSPNSAGSGAAGDSDRPVSFFDPFETVIDEGALTSLVAGGDHPDGEDHESQQQGDRGLRAGGARGVAESASVETVIENSARGPEGEGNKENAQQQQQQALERPSGRRLEPLSGIAPPQPTPAKKRQSGAQRAKQQRKPKLHEDERDSSSSSSSSSSEDDRIQIVICPRDVGAATGSGGADARAAPLVPLLPPPPSKSSMRQARERGQVEDMPSPIMSYKSRRQGDDGDDDSDGQQGAGGQPTAGEQPPSTQQQQQQVVESRGPGDEDEDEDEDDRDDGQFVIRMAHDGDGDGEMDDGDNYGKPETPLYDDDTSYVLEEFPARYDGPGWEMMLRYPPKKKLTANRFWKKIFVKLAQVPLAPLPAGGGGGGGDTNKTSPSLAVVNNNKQTEQQQQQQQDSQTAAGPMCWALQIYDHAEDKKPMQEIPIQATYTISEISSQLFDQFGKIFTIKLQYIFYKERVGVRQGQLARFIHTGHIGSTSTTSGGHGVDPISIGAIKRMGAPIEHSPQISQIIKLGCVSYEDIKTFKESLEECLFRMPIARDRALTSYKTEEVQMAVRDETYIEINQIGTVTRQLARVRLFFLSFLNGTPLVEVGINDFHRQGREVVGRMDILPVVTEEWIRLEAWELHSTVEAGAFEDPQQRLVRLTPPDATFFELMRFRVRPPRNRELPLQISANMSVTRTRVSINCEVMVPGCVSRKHGQIPCENIAIRVQVPECWIYFFREEKHFRMGSKKSVNRRPGKVKGIERFLGGSGPQDFSDDSSLIEVTSGQAKYEHHHHAVVWRAARWPKETQAAYVQNTMKIRLPLTAYDKMPESFCEYVHVEYTMPATTVSHTTLRSISVNPCDEEPPEKYVKYAAKYEYKVKMRLSVNLGNRPGQGAAASGGGGGGGGGGPAEAEPEASPIVIMKQPDTTAEDDLQREADSDDDDDDDDDDEGAGDLK